MQLLERKDIRYDSKDGRSRIAGYIYTNPNVTPFCVLQLSHGMTEHIPRYEIFAAYLAANGVAVCGNDHMGHGSSAELDDDLGFFGRKGGREDAIDDLKTMNDKIREMFPGLPVVLLGHSMGSFFARQYAVKYPKSINGLIISGTGGPNPLAGIGIGLTSMLSKTRGPRYRSGMVHYMAFGSYLKKIKKPNTVYDWISRDEEIVRIYAADPRCTFRFTVNGFHELFSALKDVSSPQWATGITKDMPVLMIQGSDDPVGGYGKGTDKVRDWLKGAGVKNLEYITYPGARHEVLNETNREEVYADILNFIEKNFKKPQD